MKKVYSIIKKIILGFLILYTYNLIASSYNMIIPINYYTLLVVSLLDGPGLILLVTILKIFYW